MSKYCVFFSSLIISSVVHLSLFAELDPSFTVIVNEETPTQSLKKHQLRNIYMGRRVFWEQGQDRIKPAYLTKHPATEAFLIETLKTSESKFVAFWRRQLFSAKGIPPRKFERVENLLEYVSDNIYAIGVIPPEVNLKKWNKIKVISVK